MLRLLCWEGSKSPGSDHTRAKAQTTCVRKTAVHTTYASIYGLTLYKLTGWLASLDLRQSRILNLISSPITRSFFFNFGFAATQVAPQEQQERTQVVCSNKVARKRLARRHSRNGPWKEWRTRTHLFVCLLVCLFVRWKKTRKTILRLLFVEK